MNINEDYYKKMYEELTSVCALNTVIVERFYYYTRAWIVFFSRRKSEHVFDV